MKGDQKQTRFPLSAPECGFSKLRRTKVTGVKSSRKGEGIDIVVFKLNKLFTTPKTPYLPKCWATSKTSLLSLPCTSRAFRMGGNPSSNWTSTTAPMTATIRPVAVPAFGAADACAA